MENHSGSCSQLSEVHVSVNASHSRLTAHHAHVSTFAACAVLIGLSAVSFVADQTYPFVSLKCLRHADDSRATQIDPTRGLPEDIDCQMQRSAWVSTDGSM